MDSRCSYRGAALCLPPFDSETLNSLVGRSVHHWPASVAGLSRCVSLSPSVWSSQFVLLTRRAGCDCCWRRTYIKFHWIGTRVFVSVCGDNSMTVAYVKICRLSREYKSTVSYGSIKFRFVVVTSPTSTDRALSIFNIPFICCALVHLGTYNLSNTGMIVSNLQLGLSTLGNWLLACRCTCR